MLFKRGSTISAAEGGCQAEVGGALIRIIIENDGVHATIISCVFYGQCWFCCLHGCIARNCPSGPCFCFVPCQLLLSIFQAAEIGIGKIILFSNFVPFVYGPQNIIWD